MARRVTLLELFLSSPSDLTGERDFIVSVARDWNLTRGRAASIQVAVLTWEDVVASGLGSSSQQVIDEAVGSDYDVYLGLMWSRFGSPTARAESGTIDEFNSALDRYRAGGKLKLAMFFKTSPIPQSLLIGSEFDKIQQFKSRFSKEGGLYKEFSNNDDLRKVLNALIEDVVKSLGTAQVSEADALGEDDLEGMIVHEENRNCDAIEDDIGLLEFQERLTEVAQQQGQFFEGLTSAASAQSAVLERVSVEMNEAVASGNVDTGHLKKINQLVETAYLDTAKYIAEHIDSFIVNNDKLISLTEAGMDITNDFEGAKTSLLEEVINLVSILDSNESSISENILALQAMPRLSQTLNIAKKILVGRQSQLLEEITRLRLALTKEIV